MYLGETKHMTVTIRLGDFYVCKIEMVKIGSKQDKILNDYINGNSSTTILDIEMKIQNHFYDAYTPGNTIQNQS